MSEEEFDPEEADGTLGAPREEGGMFWMPMGISLGVFETMPPEEFADLLDVMLLEARKRFIDEYRLRREELPQQ